MQSATYSIVHIQIAHSVLLHALLGLWNMSSFLSRATTGMRNIIHHIHGCMAIEPLELILIPQNIRIHEYMYMSKYAWRYAVIFKIIQDFNRVKHMNEKKRIVKKWRKKREHILFGVVFIVLSFPLFLSIFVNEVFRIKIICYATLTAIHSSTTYKAIDRFITQESRSQTSTRWPQKENTHHLGNITVNTITTPNWNLNEYLLFVSNDEINSTTS